MLKGKLTSTSTTINFQIMPSHNLHPIRPQESGTLKKYHLIQLMAWSKTTTPINPCMWIVKTDIDIGHHQLLDHAIPQHSPCTSPGVRYSEEVLSYSIDGLIKNYHPNQSMYVDSGNNIINETDNTDPLSQACRESNNVYYPFALKAEWELAEWLSSSSLSQSSINKFLHLDWVHLATLY